MLSKPLVSVIIPTYKSTDSLTRAINSALNQSYNNLEVIVVDDNNSNSEHRKVTESIMAKYSDNPRVIYVKHKENKNGAAARNTGFKYSKGKYICLLDDDDIFLESKVEKQVAYLEEHKQYQAAYCWRIQHGKVVTYSKVGKLTKELLSLEYTPFTSSIMIKRCCYEKLGGFDESYRRHQDFEFLIRFFRYYDIGVVEEPLVEIRGNEVNNRLHGIELEKLKDQFLKQFEFDINRIDKVDKGFKKLVYARNYSTVFLDYIKRGNFIRAINILYKYFSIAFFTATFKNIYIYIKVKISRKTMKIKNGRI